MDSFRTIIVTFIFFAIWALTFFTISALAPDVPGPDDGYRASNTFNITSNKIGKTAPYVYGGFFAGLGLAIGGPTLANRILKKIQKKTASEE